MKNKNVNSAIIGVVATGVIASTTAYMMKQSKPINPPKTAQKLKKYTNKALKSVGNVVENVSDKVK